MADLLLALGFVANQHWPRRVFHGVGARFQITLSPVGDPVDLGAGSWTMSWGDADTSDEPIASLSLDVASGDPATRTLDGVALSTSPDRRRFAASALLPAVDETFARLRGDLVDWPDPHPDGGPTRNEDEYSRVTDPGRYRLLAVRADAWVESITAAGLGVAEQVDPADVTWLGDRHATTSRVTALRGAAGTQPIVIGFAVDDTFVRVGVGDPVEVLDLQPDCGCDACDTGSVDLLEAVDSAFILALSGGVYVVRDGAKIVTRSLDGWGASGTFARDEPERWLSEAVDRRRTHGVVRGDAWL